MGGFIFYNRKGHEGIAKVTVVLLLQKLDLLNHRGCLKNP